ncbi:glycosyltransferase family 2 protein [Clostridium celatum]|uniref:Glycosyltransferase, group 2 family protein n=1 Tax=Clostridium celatum DSM 1785 TaxID=545697 RepID=L1QM57_9CLOT|nr:glycosyltransferase family 2 protein [Clostridium celatum]EKY29021.1 glycosyltransferase, group 2 family protein [Clostridium celatum DSM 1785]
MVFDSLPIISVIVPVYNVEKYLKRCVDSILNQEMKEIEVILVNDGSTDSSASICDEYVRRDSRIKVIHKKNSRVAAARNDGIRLASGKYISFIDSDDWIESNMYKSMYEKAEEFNVDFIMCDFSKKGVDKSYNVSQPISSGFYDKDRIKKKYSRV